MASKSRRFLRYALVAVGGLSVGLIVVVAVCWIAGGMGQRHLASAEINAPKEVVFKHLTDPESLKKWIEGVEEIQPLDDLGNAPGAKSRIICAVDGESFEMEEEIEGFREPDVLGIKLSSPMFTMHNVYQLSEDDGVTTITHSTVTEFHGLARLMAPFIHGATQEQLDKNIAALKQLVEEEG